MRVLALFLVLGVGACSRGESASTVPTSEAPAEAEAPSEAPVAASEGAASETPPCGRNSSELCECPGGGSALRICVEGTWADCPCENAEEAWEDDGLGFDDEPA